MTLQSHKIPGTLPVMWDRSVVYFANILSLFYGNEQEITALREEVGTLESYGSRLIPIINIIFRKGSNTLFLERTPEKSLLDYFTHTLNLSLPEIKVLSRRNYLSMGRQKGEDRQNVKDHLDALRKNDAQWIDGYVTDVQLARIAEITQKKTISSINGSYHGNNKVLLHQHIEKNGLPIFDTHIANNIKEVKACFIKLKAYGYRSAVVKASIGASGIGMMKVELSQDSNRIPEYLFYEGPCLVQGWLDQTVKGVRYIGSPSVQMFIKDKDITLHDITEQILSKESVHEGNISPPTFVEYKEVKDELLSQAELAGLWLHDQGYRGTGSTDFHLIKRNGQYEVRICEINARVTGSTYPSMLAHTLMPKGAWLMRNLRFSPPQMSEELLSLLVQENLLFEPGGSKGILPINLNTNDRKEVVKGQFLILGKSHQDVFSLLKKICENHEFKGIYDRD